MVVLSVRWERGEFWAGRYAQDLPLTIAMGPNAIQSLQVANVNVAVITMPSRMDTRNSLDLRSLFTKVSDWGFAYLILDCTPVAFLDSSGLGVLVTAYKLCQQKQGQLLLFGAQSQAMLALDLAGLAGAILPCFADQAEALARLEALLVAGTPLTRSSDSSVVL